MPEIRQAAILCGGLGTRLRPYTDTLPKPMIPVDGRPFLAFLLEQLKGEGIERVVLMTGYRGDQIEAHFGDGRDLGLAITYARGPIEWETGRRLWEARALLDPLFLLLYADNFTPFRLDRLLRAHRDGRRPVTVLLSAKPDGNIALGADGGIARYDPTRAGPGLTHVEIGYMAVARDPVVAALGAGNVDSSFSTTLRRLADRGELGGLVTRDHYHSVSDPVRWQRLECYLRPSRVLLLDRDGTLNRRPPKAQYLTRWEDFTWASGAFEGLVALAACGFSFVLISNQAGIARGLVTRNAVDAINTRLAEDLAARGIAVLRAYVCPHHWDEGCACRKPEPGMLFEASRDLLLRLDRTFYIGDDRRDCEAAFNAGCPSIFIGDAAELDPLPAEARPLLVAETLAAAVPFIVKQFRAWEQGRLYSA